MPAVSTQQQQQRGDMTGPAPDLFGNTEHPPKGRTTAYLAWLAALDYDLMTGAHGLTFHKRSTAPLAPGVPAEHVDVILCTGPDGKWWQLVVDLRTQRLYRRPDG